MVITSRASSSGVVPRIVVGRVFSFAGSFKAGCEGYRISKRVDRKVQIKVKYLESEPVAVHFLLTQVNLVKEWHQMTAIPKIRKVSMI
jgi:hypothetical protein